MRLLKVGRDSNCDIVLHSNMASALHAEITILNNGDILLEDKNSHNGTFVMNRPIKPGTQVSIKRGDAIRFGDVELLWSQIPQPEDLSKYKAVYGIGTSMRNEIQITGNTVSRYHATLKIDRNGKAWLEDHSKNGSTVNGVRLNNGQTKQIKRSDAIVCGGVPVNLSQFIPSNNLPKIVGIVAAIVLVLACAWGAWKLIPWSSTVSPATVQAMENASACVYGSYYFEINVTDDPFKTVLKDIWPDKWYIGYDADGDLKAQTNTTGLSPIGYYGTAFFISKNGEMGTNRHVAVPWEYRSAEMEEEIRQLMEKARQSTSGDLVQILQEIVNEGRLSATEANAWLHRYQISPVEIGGRHILFGVGLTGSKVNSQIDLQQAQVIAESGDAQKDVALIRLNTRKTPDYLVEMGAVYDIEKARVDETSLKPQEEDLITTGYPMGGYVGYQTFDGKELHPTIHKATLSKMPDDNQIQIQAIGIGGQSGSPVVDKSHRLVGVLCSGIEGSEVTYCCNIKHLVELYNRYRVRE